MRLRLLLILIVLFSFASEAKEIPAKERFRLEECYRVIDAVGKRFWPALVGFRGPWVYVTEDGQYAVNHPKILSGFEEVGLKSRNIQWRNQGQMTLDGADHSSDPVFVFNSVSTDPKDLDYKRPIVYAASIELVKKTVPLSDTEDWMSLFLHEVFHQFQFTNYEVFKQYARLKERGLFLDSSELAQVYQRNDWFKASILEENRTLLLARREKSLIKKRDQIKRFFQLRELRRSRYLEKFGKSLGETEAIWEMLEGGARYFEYGTFRVLGQLSPNAHLTKVDSLYGANKRYQSPISIETMEDLDRDPKRTRYFYTTGFNLYLLLEEMRPGFQRELFRRPPFYAEELLLKNAKI